VVVGVRWWLWGGHKHLMPVAGLHVSNLGKGLKLGGWVVVKGNNRCPGGWNHMDVPPKGDMQEVLLDMGYGWWLLRVTQASSLVFFASHLGHPMQQ
jgi:hypothetical protein